MQVKIYICSIKIKTPFKIRLFSANHILLHGSVTNLKEKKHHPDGNNSKQVSFHTPELERTMDFDFGAKWVHSCQA